MRRGTKKKQAKLKHRALCAICHHPPMGNNNASTINHLSTAASCEYLLMERAAGGVDPRCLQRKEATQHKTSYSRLINTHELLLQVHTNMLSFSSLSLANTHTHTHLSLISLNGLQRWTSSWCAKRSADRHIHSGWQIGESCSASVCQAEKQS